MKNNFFKSVSALIIGLVILSIILPFIINFCIGFIDSNFTWMAYVPLDSWVGFLGGFLGAGFTLIGIYYQIETLNLKDFNELENNTNLIKEIISHKIEVIEKSINMYHEEPVYPTHLFDQNQIFTCSYDDFKSDRDLIYSLLNKSIKKERILLLKLTNDLEAFFYNIKSMRETYDNELKKIGLINFTERKALMVNTLRTMMEDLEALKDYHKTIIPLKEV